MKTLSKIKPMKVEKVHTVNKIPKLQPLKFKISIIEASKLSKPKKFKK